MSAGRDTILAGIRSALGRGALDSDAQAEIDARLAKPTRNLIPERAQLPAAEQVDRGDQLEAHRRGSVWVCRSDLRISATIRSAPQRASSAAESQRVPPPGYLRTTRGFAESEGWVCSKRALKSRCPAGAE